MAKEEQGNSSKEEFTNRINKQKGRISSKLIEETKYLSQTQKQSWNEKGFILIPNFFPEDKCIEINQTVVDIVRSMAGNSEEFNHAYIDQGHIGIREMKPSQKIENIEDEMSKVFRLHQTGIFNEFIKRDDLLNIVEDILGENIDCFLSQFIFKNPGAWGQPWHQDSSYFPFDRAPQVGAWLATSAATKENGCLVILPGSHKEVIHEHLPDDRPGSNYGYTEIKDHDFKKEMPLFLNTGDLLLFHSFLMHKSYDNKSNNRRTAMVYHFAETGTDFGELDSPTNEWISVRGKGLP
ncbi:MAG: phytanoyl-CoA dioxygenase family protein [SAR86 cluster bacterium]|nr:phytanoyl-CoA dioxygenase family protein [SAR86 cluster bacterium]